MIALDTNVLVRFVVDDPAAVDQSRRARELIQTVVNSGHTIFLANIVLCEFVWVLTRAYRVSRTDIVRSLMGILATEQMVFESSEAVVGAIERFATEPADFADYLICGIANRSGSDTVYSFDRKLVKSGYADEP